MQYQLPKLPYAFNALEPYIDAATMEIHYTKHHQAYTDKMNAVLEKYPDLTQTPEELMKNFNNLKMDEADKKVFKNHGGGYINHALFWQIMDPAKQKDDQLVNGKSIMGILMLAAERDSEVMLIAEGSDSEEAVNELEMLLLSDE